MTTLPRGALGITRVSALPSGRWVILVTGVGMLFLLAPRLEGWTLLHVHKEDGVVFLADFVDRGWGSLLDPYTGYQHLVPRVIANTCASGPATWYAGCVGVGASMVRVVLAVIALAVVAPYAKSPGWAVLAATTFVWAPVGQQEALGNLTNLRWFLDAGAVVLLVGTWRRPWVVAAVSAVAIGAAMSDPLAVVVAPLALWRCLVLRGRERVVPLAFLISAAVHYLMLDRGARSSETVYLTDPAGAVEQLVVRGMAVPWFGQNGTEVLLLVGTPVAVIAALLVVAVAVHRLTWSPTTAVALVLAIWGGGLVAVTLTFTEMVQLGLDPAWRLGQGSRYSVPTGVLLTMGLLLVLPLALERASGLWRTSILATLSVLPLAVLADATGDPANTADPTWQHEVGLAREACAAGASSVRVQMTPADVPLDWSADLSCDWLVR